MKQFRLILDKIQDCIEIQNGATESQLKTIWNDLSNAITEMEESRTSVKNELGVGDVMPSVCNHPTFDIIGCPYENQECVTCKYFPAH